MALYVNGDTVNYFDSFKAQHIPKEIKNFQRNKNITTNIYRIKANDSITNSLYTVFFENFLFYYIT